MATEVTLPRRLALGRVKRHDDCVDDEDWSYTTKEGDVYKCDHVAKKPEKRCGRVGNDGVVASEACPKTCGTC